MARLLGPDPRQRLAYILTSAGDLVSAAGKTATVYADAAATTLADIRTCDGTLTPGAAISGSTVTVDSSSRLPLFWYPDSTGSVYVSVNSGPAMEALVVAQPAAPQPADQNLIAWSFDPTLAVSSTGPAAGVLALFKLHVRRPQTITNLLVGVATAGSGLTSGQNFVCLYTAAGALVGQSADQTAAWGTNGLKTAALTTPYNPAVGDYWGAILSNASGSTPAFARAGAGAVTGISSAGLAATAARFGAFGSALTVPPANLVLASITVATNGTFWGAAN